MLSLLNGFSEEEEMNAFFGVHMDGPALLKPTVLFLSKRTAMAEGIAEGLRNTADMTVTVISDEAEIEPLLKSGNFSVLFVDCGRGDRNLVECIDPCLRIFPDVAVSMLFDDLDAKLVSSLLDLGVRGIMVTTAKLKTIAAAIQMLAAGECYVASEFIPTPEAQSKMAERIFTRRELCVLSGLCRGMENKQIANEQGLTLDSVKNHVASIFKKLRVRNRVEAAIAARKIMPFSFEAD